MQTAELVDHGLGIARRHDITSDPIGYDTSGIGCGDHRQARYQRLISDYRRPLTDGRQKEHVSPFEMRKDLVSWNTSCQMHKLLDIRSCIREKANRAYPPELC